MFWRAHTLLDLTTIYIIESAYIYLKLSFNFCLQQLTIFYVLSLNQLTMNNARIDREKIAIEVFHFEFGKS